LFNGMITILRGITRFHIIDLAVLDDLFP